MIPGASAAVRINVLAGTRGPATRRPRPTGLLSRPPQITPPGVMPGWCAERPGAAASMAMKQNRIPAAAAPTGRSKAAIRSGTVPHRRPACLCGCVPSASARWSCRTASSASATATSRRASSGRGRSDGRGITPSGCLTSSPGRGSPAAWNEDLLQVSGATLGAAAAKERKKLHRLGDDRGVATLVLAGGRSLEVAAAPGQRSALPGPFVAATDRV